MGAATFCDYAEGANASEGFKRLRETAAWNHGHSGYTGTIAEKPGFEMRVTPRMNEKEAYRFAHDDQYTNAKWGDAYCVRVYDETRAEIIGHLFYGWASE